MFYKKETWIMAWFDNDFKMSLCKMKKKKKEKKQEIAQHDHWRIPFSVS